MAMVMAMAMAMVMVMVMAIWMRMVMAMGIGVGMGMRMGIDDIIMCQMYYNAIHVYNSRLEEYQIPPTELGFEPQMV